MKRITLNKRITLLRLEAGAGRSEPIILASAAAWADVAEASITAKNAAMQVGQTIALTVYMRRAEFDGYTHAEYGGVRYKIAQTGAAGSDPAADLFIKLQLERDSYGYL